MNPVLIALDRHYATEEPRIACASCGGMFPESWQSFLNESGERICEMACKPSNLCGCSCHNMAYHLTHVVACCAAPGTPVADSLVVAEWVGVEHQDRIRAAKLAAGVESRASTPAALPKSDKPVQKRGGRRMTAKQSRVDDTPDEDEDVAPGVHSPVADEIAVSPAVSSAETEQPAMTPESDDKSPSSAPASSASDIPDEEPYVNIEQVGWVRSPDGELHPVAPGQDVPAGWPFTVERPDVEAEEREAKFRHIVKLLGGLLIARKDVFATEHNGTWMPLRENMRDNDSPCIPMRLSDFRSHLLEKVCMGTYLLDPNSRVKFFAFDLDLKVENAVYWPIRDATEIEEAIAEHDGDEIAVNGVFEMETQIGNLEEALHDANHVGYRWARSIVSDMLRTLGHKVREELGLPSLPVVTGGGGHLLVPVGDLMPAREARACARLIMESLGNWETIKGENFWGCTTSEQFGLTIETFPKQDTIPAGGSFGNLIRLPMGYHAASGKRTYFLDTQKGAPWYLVKADAIQMMEAAASELNLEI